MMVLFLVFFQIGLFSVGGGYAAMPLIQSLVVESHGWLTMAEFTNLMTIAEMTPGPIAVNSATFVGMRCAGLPGALVATFGCITPSLILVTLLSYLYGRFRSGQTMQNVLGALRPVVVALIASAALSIVQVAAVKSGGGVSIVGIVLMVAAFLVLRWKKWNPILVMLLCGIGGALNHAKDMILGQLADAAEGEIPSILVENAYQQQMQVIQQQLQMQRMSLTTYLSQIHETRESFTAKVRAAAEKNTRARMALLQIAQQENLLPTDEEIDKQLAERAEKAKKAVEEIKAGTDVAALRRNEGIRKAADWVIDHSTIEEKVESK